jgi:hypothetical protein
VTLTLRGVYARNKQLLRKVLVMADMHGTFMRDGSKAPFLQHPLRSWARGGAVLILILTCMNCGTVFPSPVVPGT